MLNTDFAPWPCFTQEEADAVSATLLSNKVNYWTGTEGREFEKEFATFTGSNHAIALSNGTLALDLALMGLSVGAHYGGSAEDEVIVTPRTFLASVSTVVNAGARPVFTDGEADTQNISPSTIAAVLTSKTKAIICVHLAGYPCDMDGIKDLIKGKDIKLIEDCAQAHGATYKGQPVGSIGDVGAWSFCQDKIMTTGGEGGMVTCNDPALWKKMWGFKDHGKSWEAVYETDHAPGFRWLHESFGTNWRMTELQAVIGRLQLKWMPDWTAARTLNANKITQALSPFASSDGLIRLPYNTCETCSCSAAQRCVNAWYKYYAFVRPERLAEGWERDRIVHEINAAGVPCMQGSCSEVYLEKAFDGTGFRPKAPLPVAHELGGTSLMFLVHPNLTEAQMAKTADVIANVMSQAQA